MTDAPLDVSFEREKWRAEHRLREKELDLKARELEIRVDESNRARWTNPLVLAIAGAALAALGNVVATYYTGVEQRTTESLKHRAEQERERERAEAQLILEVIKTANPDKAAENLNFLVKTSLINDVNRRAAISTYVESRPAGTGVSLPIPSTFSAARGPDINHVTCKIENYEDMKAIADAIESIHRHPRWRSKTNWRSTDDVTNGETRVFLKADETVIFLITHEVGKVAPDVIVRTTLKMDPMPTVGVRRNEVESFFATMYDDFHGALSDRYADKLSSLVKRAVRCVGPAPASIKDAEINSGASKR